MSNCGLLKETSEGIGLPVTGWSGHRVQLLINLLSQKGIISVGTDGRPYLTEVGRSAVRPSSIYHHVALYRPMLANLSHLLSVPQTPVPRYDDWFCHFGPDTTLPLATVVTNHRQQPYYEALLEMVISSFNQVPLHHQPRYICHLGCQDGSFLKFFHEAISQTTRGKSLEDYPLILIGCEGNKELLNEALRMLADVPDALVGRC